VVRGDQIDVRSITGGTSAIGRGASAAVSSGLSPQEVERLFQPVLDTVRQAPADKLLQAVQTTDDLKKEVAKGKQADDSLVAQLIEGLAGLVPAAVSSLVTAFGSPILAGIAGPVTQYVLKKIQR
jgi:flagellar motor switch protein FliG